jgi:hypothetical protein
LEGYEAFSKMLVFHFSKEAVSILRTGIFQLFHPLPDTFVLGAQEISSGLGSFVWGEAREVHSRKNENMVRWVPVTHGCNPSYLGGSNQEDRGSKPARPNNS